MTEKEALDFLKTRGYRLNKALQYDSNTLYLVRRTKNNDTVSFTTRRTPNPTFNYKTKLKKEEVAKLDLSTLDWETVAIDSEELK